MRTIGLMKGIHKSTGGGSWLSCVKSKSNRRKMDFTRRRKMQVTNVENMAVKQLRGSLNFSITWFVKLNRILAGENAHQGFKFWIQFNRLQYKEPKGCHCVIDILKYRKSCTRCNPLRKFPIRTHSVFKFLRVERNQPWTHEQPTRCLHTRTAPFKSATLHACIPATWSNLRTHFFYQIRPTLPWRASTPERGGTIILIWADLLVRHWDQPHDIIKKGKFNSFRPCSPTLITFLLILYLFTFHRLSITFPSFEDHLSANIHSASIRYGFRVFKYWLFSNSSVRASAGASDQFRGSSVHFLGREAGYLPDPTNNGYLLLSASLCAPEEAPNWSRRL